MRYIIRIGGDFGNSAIDYDILGRYSTSENNQRSYIVNRNYFDFSADDSAGDFGKIFFFIIIVVVVIRLFYGTPLLPYGIVYQCMCIGGSRGGGGYGGCNPPFKFQK